MKRFSGIQLNWFCHRLKNSKVKGSLLCKILVVVIIYLRLSPTIRDVNFLMSSKEFDSCINTLTINLLAFC